MKNYEKPIVKLEEEKAEGVYMASGDSIDGNNSGSGCYTVSAYIHQTPEIGREDYRIQVNAHHSASHNCNGQILTLNFNQPVTYQSSGGSYRVVMEHHQLKLSMVIGTIVQIISVLEMLLLNLIRDSQ